MLKKGCVNDWADWFDLFCAAMCKYLSKTAYVYVDTCIYSYMHTCTMYMYVCTHTHLCTHTCKQIKKCPWQVTQAGEELRRAKGCEVAAGKRDGRQTSLQTFITRSCWCSERLRMRGADWGNDGMGGQSENIHSMMFKNQKKQLLH